VHPTRGPKPDEAGSLPDTCFIRFLASVKPTPAPTPVPLHEDRLFRAFVMISSALGIGGVVSSLTLLSSGPNGFEFHWSNLALPAFLIGALLSTGYWWIVFRMSSRSTVAEQKFLTIASILMLVLGVVAFLYPIRFIPQQKRADVIIGLSAAILVLGTIGYIIYSLVHWLEQDSEEGPPEGPDGAA